MYVHVVIIIMDVIWEGGVHYVLYTYNTWCVHM